MNKSQLLTTNEMQGISGGQVTSCLEFMQVLDWLDEHNPEQAAIIEDAYIEQYCFQ